MSGQPRWTFPLRSVVADEGDVTFVGDPTADRLHGPPGAIGGSTYVGGERFQRPVPQVVGTPPLNLVEQSGVEPPCSIAAERNA